MAWFICPMREKPNPDYPVPVSRYCAMDDFTVLIRADGGEWSETEVLGNAAIVKVRANAATLTAIGAAVGFQRIPIDVLTQLLSTLSGAQRTAIRNRILAMGYTDAEITAALGANIGQRTLAQVLRFVATKRLRPRWDAVNQLIVVDGPVEIPRAVDAVDAAVQA